MRLEVGVHWLSMWVNVSLDGVEEKGCVMADEELGVIERFAMADGYVAIDGNGEPITELLMGKVEISLSSDAPAHAVADFQSKRGAQRRFIPPLKEADGGD